MRLALSIIVLVTSFVILGLFVEIEKVIESLSKTKPSLAIFAALFLYCHFLLRAERLKNLIKFEISKPFQKIIFISNLGNLIFPLRLGEMIKIGLLNAVCGQKVSVSFYAVFIERILDLIFIILLATVLLFILDLNLQQYLKQLTFFLLIVLIGICVIGLIKFNFFKVVTPRWERFHSVITSLRESTVFLNLRIVLLTFGIWFCTMLFHFFTLRSCAISSGFEGALLLTFLNSVMISVPSSPGFIGPYQISFVLTAKMLNLDVNSALAASIVSHALNYLVLIPTGINSLTQLGMSWKNIMNLKRYAN
ncbi:MAG: flippase-like domain-containing protein [Deltaproteobacteria bacterium]|nr:flippase-like domain-containing protein [Deltaproteobacteria bacterium]